MSGARGGSPLAGAPSTTPPPPCPRYVRAKAAHESRVVRDSVRLEGRAARDERAGVGRRDHLSLAHGAPSSRLRLGTRSLRRRARSTAPGHTRGAAAEPMAPRGAWWARGGRPCGQRASWRYVWHEVPINGRVINGPSAADQSTRFSIMECYNWLFRGSCGLTPRPRCQPGSGAARSEPVFPTKREGPARRRRRHAMVAEALVPPGATRVATVYTNAPIR